MEESRGLQAGQQFIIELQDALRAERIDIDRILRAVGRFGTSDNSRLNVEQYHELSRAIGVFERRGDLPRAHQNPRMVELVKTSLNEFLSAENSNQPLARELLFESLESTEPRRGIPVDKSELDELLARLGEDFHEGYGEDIR